MKKDNAYIAAAIVTSLEAVGVAVGCGLAADFRVSPFWWYFPMWIVPAVCVAGFVVYCLFCLFVSTYIQMMIHKEDKIDIDPEDKKDDKEETEK